MMLRALLFLFACLIALAAPVSAHTSTSCHTFVPPPVALFGVDFSDEQDCGPLTLHLDGLHDRAGPCGGVLVRQNPWTMFDPEGLFQADPRALYEQAQQAFQAAPPNQKPLIGAAVAVTFVAAVVTVAGNELTKNAKPMLGCGPNSCASGPMSSGVKISADQGFAFTTKTQDDADAFSKFLTGRQTDSDRAHRELREYINNSMDGGGSPGGKTGKEIAANSGGRLRDPKTGRFVSDPANPPSPHTYTDAQRRKDWKRLADDPNSGLSDADRAQIRERGNRGPQRVNENGDLETMELSHEPVPLREGGTNVVPRWPTDHAAVDPHRKLKK